MSDSNNTMINNEATETTPTTASKQATVETATENVNEASASEEAQSSMTPDSPNKLPNLEFTRANIQALGNSVHLVDSDEDSKLDMFCYLKCGESDNELLKQCRGVVFNEDNLVMKAFPYTNEYCHTNRDDIITAVETFGDWTFYEAHEGALIRMFYFNGKWFVSTHRKLNAFRSKWASRESFGTSFKNALMAEEVNNEVFKAALPAGENILERFQSTLDTSKQYMFLIRNTNDNRIVCFAPDKPTVYHVGTFVNGNLFTPGFDDTSVNLPTPKRLSFLNVDELLSFVEKISYKHLQGVIGFTKDNRQVKILHKDYQDLFRARGNEPSIKFRYLQVRMNRRFVNMLYHLYPNMAETFDEYENTIYDIARSIYRAYVQRFIKKRYVTVPREEFSVIRECHTWHLSDRAKNRISLDQVIRILNQQSPTNLNHMIRRFKLEQSRQKEQQSQVRPRSDSMRSTRSFEQSPVVRNLNSSTSRLPPVPQLGTPNVQTTQSRTSTLLPRKPLYKPKQEQTEVVQQPEVEEVSDVKEQESNEGVHDNDSE